MFAWEIMQRNYLVLIENINIMNKLLCIWYLKSENLSAVAKAPTTDRQGIQQILLYSFGMFHSPGLLLSVRNFWVNKWVYMS